MAAQPLPLPKKSTNGRTKNGPPAATLALVRGALSLVSRVAPPLAISWATRLFLSPRRHRRPARETELLARAEALPREEDGVAAWRWGRGPVVLLVHGWEGRGAQLGAFVDPLVRADYQVVAFDAPAHGVTSGSQATLADFAGAIRNLEARLGPLHAIIGHSFGAAAAALALSQGVDVRCAVFVAAPWDMETGLRYFARVLDLSPEVARGVKERVERRVGQRWEEVEGAAIAPRMTVPLLVVHDRGDEEVRWEAGATLARAWPDATLLTTEGLGHRRILRAPQVLGAAVEFLERFSPSVRPGSELERVLDLEGVRV